MLDNLEDLLDRSPIRIDARAVRATISGKSILVTGAAGSIGSSLVGRLTQLEPKSLVLLDRDEHGLHGLRESLIEATPPSREPHLVLGDLLDDKILDDLIWRYQPDFIFHAAALKQLPLLEEQPLAALRCNALGTHRLLLAASHTGARLILVSTDKAVRPRSLLGASKRLAEMILQGTAASSEMRPTAVRLGNVLGSRGSVIPLFLEQARAGKPLRLTHPQARRFFLTTSEAADLILEAARLGEGRDILVPELGEAVRIEDLALRVLERVHPRGPEECVPPVSTHGCMPAAAAHDCAPADTTDDCPPASTTHDREYRAAGSLATQSTDADRHGGRAERMDFPPVASRGAIRYIGLRPGEKLEEELLGSDEVHVETQNPVLRRVVGPLPRESDLVRWLNGLESAIMLRRADVAVAILCDALPGYAPSDLLRQSLALQSLSPRAGPVRSRGCAGCASASHEGGAPGAGVHDGDGAGARPSVALPRGPTP